MAIHSQHTPVKAPAGNAANDRKRSQAATPVASETLQRVQQYCASGQPQKAVDLLQSGSRDPRSRNALGVSLLRAGRYPEAVSIFRALVLTPGATFERHEASPIYKLNFATALLLDGRPRGCLAVITDGRLQDHPRAIEIKAAIANWTKSLSWLRRLDWNINGVDPPVCHVPITFEPGLFDYDVA